MSNSLSNEVNLTNHFQLFFKSDTSPTTKTYQEPTFNNETHNNNTHQNTTTELTVVKEIRKEMLSNHSSHISSFSSLTQQESTCDNNNNNENMHNCSNGDDILKVDEETLYIVEKRRPKSATIDKSADEDFNNGDETQDIIDMEIRKNFELKEKPVMSKKSVSAPKAPSSTTSSGLSASSLSEKPPAQPSLIDESTAAPSTNYIELNQLDYEYELLRINLIQLIDDLRQSILNFNTFTAYQAINTSPTSSSSTATALAPHVDANDYQLHFVEHSPVLVMLFDKKNAQNYKYTLEKCYNKSIIDTHNLNNKQDINLIANLSVFYIETRYIIADPNCIWAESLKRIQIPKKKR